MEYIIIGLNAFVILLLFFSLHSNRKNRPTFDEHILKETQKETEMELKLYFQKEYKNIYGEMVKLFGDHSKTNQADLNQFKEHMMEHIDKQLQKINEKVETRLGEGFEKTKDTFVNVIERLTKIDEAQKKIEILSNEVVSLNEILTDKKTRGIYGEVQLYQLLSTVFGDHKNLYEKQKKLSNDYIVDAVVYAPDPIGMIAIDSKFPLENYKRMIDRTSGEADRKFAEKEFKNDVKKHINDIKDKYIVSQETSDQAFMFVPAEAIFAEITAYHDDLVQHATKNKVWLASPTTLISTLTMIQVALNNLDRDKHAKVIITELEKLAEEFKRYSERWDKLKRSIEGVSKNAEQVHVTSSKINQKFEQINKAKFNQIETDEIDEVSIEDDESID